MKLNGRLARRTGVRRRYYHHVTVLLALIFGATLLTSVIVWAATVDNLDPTFDGDGIATASINDYDEGHDLAIQTDGKIVVVGRTANPVTNKDDFAVTRFNPNGSPDATFGNSGSVTTSIAGNSIAQGVAIQSDGKIVVVGSTDVTQALIVVRYNADGSLDTSFGSGGIVNSFVGLGVTSMNDVVIQADGKIIVVGDTRLRVDSALTLVRLNSDGSFDNSFEGDGVFIAPSSSAPRPFSGKAVALQSDGKIVAAGAASTGTGVIDFAILRCNNDGSVDTTFGTDGVVVTDTDARVEAAEDVAIQPDGKIVAVGTTGFNFSEVFTIARYNSDGSLDTSLDGDGIVTAPLIESVSEEAHGVALQTDGKIVVAGERDFGSGSIIEVRRYNGDGSPDATFGGGTVTTAVGISEALAVAIQADGKIVAAGSGNFGFSETGFVQDFAVVRYSAAAAVNNPPVVTITGPANGAIYSVGTPVNFTATFTDDAGDTHTAEWHFESINQSATVGEPSGATPGTANTTYTFTESGVYNVSLTVTDNGNLSGTANTVNNLPAVVVVYDPDGGWVTGNGWINSPPGAFAPMPSLTGKAIFGFVSKYHNGASVPTGNTQFQFMAGGLQFKSTSYEWMVISGGRKAQYKGFGTINGGGNYRFLLTCIDGDKPGGGGIDKFRIRIWSDSNGLVYDNQLNAPDSDDPTTTLGGGSIIVHP